MNTRLRFVLLFILLLVYPATTLCQWVGATNDTLVDVFPLSVGNQWMYRYFTLTEVWPAGNPVETRTDSGQVTYDAIGSTTTTDSTRWQFRVRRDLMRHQILWLTVGDPHDTTYPIRDSSYFDLIESHQGQHQVYRNANPYQIRLEVFPFTRAFIETTMISRLRTVGEGDTTTFQSWIAPPPGGTFRSRFTFQRNVGLIRNSYHSGTMDVYSTNEHYLLNSIITSVGQRSGASIPSSFILQQNFPNPFNPGTTIGFLITRRARVTVKVFDVLGREVATLVNGVLEPGYKSVWWDARNVASGVYMYQLKSGAFVEARRMLLMK